MHHFESCKPAHILATLLFHFKALEKLLIVGLGLETHISPLSAIPACSQRPSTPRVATGWSGGDVAAGYTCSGKLHRQGICGPRCSGLPFLAQVAVRISTDIFKGSTSWIEKSGRGNKANNKWHNNWYHHYTRTSNPAFKGNYSTSTAGLISYLTWNITKQRSICFWKTG